MSRYSLFDRSRLDIHPLNTRIHDLDLSNIREIEHPEKIHPKLDIVGHKIQQAKKKNASVMLLMGAHVIRSGVQRYIIDMIKNGEVSCIALNGAGVIHDYEFALIGATTESVARYISEGQFGLWEETGQINDIVNKAHEMGSGIGEAVGEHIYNGEYPHKDISILAAAWEHKVPVTVHVGIGYDILHEHPNCHGGAWGDASYTDFLIFASLIEKLEGGVVLSFGSAVMAPEVYLKALAMARNVARQEGRDIKHFSTLVCDLAELPEDYTTEAQRGSSAYYFRPWKTMLVRTVADGGESFYVKGVHAETIPQLWSAINHS